MLFKLWVMLLHFISAEEIICSLFSENEDVKGLLGMFESQSLPLCYFTFRHSPSLNPALHSLNPYLLRTYYRNILVSKTDESPDFMQW